MITVECTNGDSGLSPLTCLCRHIPTAPPAYLRQLVQKGRVTRAGIPISTHDAVRAGDILSLPASGRLQALLASSTREPTILFESREILVVTKPAGLAVHAGFGHEMDNLTGQVQQLLRRRRERFQVAPVHRLDAATSGPVLFGKGRQACAALGKLFMAGTVEKSYLGLAAGYIPETGELTSPVLAHGKWKPSRTAYAPVAWQDNFTLLRLHLHSGRTHQIRRQLATAGHPLAGDRRYGGPSPPGLDRLFLHGCHLALSNPFDGSLLAIDCPLPAELAAVLTGPAIPPAASGNRSATTANGQE